jgi:hypothetical protein
MSGDCALSLILPIVVIVVIEIRIRDLPSRAVGRSDRESPEVFRATYHDPVSS